MSNVIPLFRNRPVLVPEPRKEDCEACGGRGEMGSRDVCNLFGAPELHPSRPRPCPRCVGWKDPS